jgi:hypothetical protein
MKKFQWTDRHGTVHDIEADQVDFEPSHVVFRSGDIFERKIVKAIHNDNVRKVVQL